MAKRSTKKNSKVAPVRPRSRGRYVPRRKVCPFCVERNAIVDYKDSGRLRRFLTDRCKIATRRRTGVCAGHQRELALAIKRARHLALLPYTPAHTRATV